MLRRMGQRVLPVHPTPRHRQLLTREVGLLIGITIIALLLQVGGHQIPLILLDVALMISGLVGLVAAVLMADKADRWWFIGLAATALITGAAQLFWSSGLAIGLLVLIAIPPVFDALANIAILALRIWPQFGRKA